MLVEEKKLVRCEKCDQALPLRPDRRAQAVRDWACCKCGHVYHGLFDIESPQEYWDNARLPSK